MLYIKYNCNSKFVILNIQDETKKHLAITELTFYNIYIELAFGKRGGVMKKYYREEIKKMIEKLDDEKRLKYIYQVLVSFLSFRG